MTNLTQRLHIRLLTREDLKKILEVQEVTYRQLEQKESLSTLGRDEWQHLLSGAGWAAGAFIGDVLIALRALLVPEAHAPDHLGKDAGLDVDSRASVIYQEITTVLPDYRGHKLQLELGNWLMDMLKKLDHPYRYVCATVAPFNIPSLKDKFAQGMHVVALKEKYGGKLRYIFLKDIQQTEKEQRSKGIWIPMRDLTRQQKAMEQGMRGNQLEERVGEYGIWYQKQNAM